MKTDIHPEYKKTVIKCACGTEFETKSTVSPEIRVELCSACHPFYTGKQKFVDTAGRVDKFRARLEKAEAKKTTVKNKAEAVTDNDQKTNQEKLAEIKKDISVKKADSTEAAMAVSQEDNSSVAAAALDQIKDQSGDHNKSNKQ